VSSPVSLIDPCIIAAAIIIISNETALSSEVNFGSYLPSKTHEVQKIKGEGVPGILGEWMYSSTHSLTSALDVDEWSSSRLCRFTHKERAPGTHWIGGWVGPRAGLDAVVKRKIPSHCRVSNPQSSSGSCRVAKEKFWNYVYAICISFPL
jgi:hypothetical protein